MNWSLATDIILYSSIALLAVLALFGLYQWISRKSLKKVDRALRLIPLPLVLMVITYFIFDNLLILATAPNDPTKPSFPSTHVMVVATIFLLVALILPRYLKSKPLRLTIDFLMLTLFAVVAAGRIIIGAHWPTDVACGAVFAIIFATVYYLMLKEKK